ncbi:MAG TPA: IclR family transcriptional regulator [Thermoleophilia bacterium]|nr:IclR family transcriptional regulator [Thermoleophilia bacterium]
MSDHTLDPTDYPPDEAAFSDEADIDETGAGSLVQSVQRALRIVRLFDFKHPEWVPAELARRSGLRRTTALRLIRTLEAEGVLTLNEQSGKYSLGPAVFQFAYVWIAEAALARIATPYLERLADATHESVGLTVWNDDGPLCIAHSPSPRPFKFLMYVGQTFTDVSNAHSKVLLGFGPEERRSRALARPLERLTPFTVVDRERYADELRKVAAEGIAYDIQEQQVGVCALAVPVRDFSGEVRASLSLVVSEMRYGPAEARRYAQALKQVSAALSYELGYREPVL